MQNGLLANVRIVVPHEFADAAIELLADSIDNDYRDDNDTDADPDAPVRPKDIDESADV
jgi:hypothetical protein